MSRTDRPGAGFRFDYPVYCTRKALDPGNPLPASVLDRHGESRRPRAHRPRHR